MQNCKEGGHKISPPSTYLMFIHFYSVTSNSMPTGLIAVSLYGFKVPRSSMFGGSSIQPCLLISYAPSFAYSKISFAKVISFAAKSYRRLKAVPNELPTVAKSQKILVQSIISLSENGGIVERVACPPEDEGT